MPFHPRPYITMSSVGAWVTGLGNEYRFEIRHFDGRVVVIERHISPVEVSAGEADWRRQRAIDSARRRDPTWSWPGPEVPRHKPYFDVLLPDRSGRVWVRRLGPSTYYGDCSEAPGSAPRPDDQEPTPCWRAAVIYDVFGADGRYLGGVDFPRGYPPVGDAFIRDDLFLLRGEDEAGTIMVKRYRLVLPGER